MAIKASTEIKAPIGVVIGAVVSLAGIMWLITTFVFGEVKDDVALIREDVSALRAKSEEKVTELATSNSDVEKALIDLAAKLEITNARLQDLSSTIVAVDQRLALSVQRQEDFERFILTRLPVPASLPLPWSQLQNELVKELSGGTDPLQFWLDKVQN